MTDISDRLQSELGGRYTIERELGRGGMATVHLARDLRHDRPVALKVLHPELAAVLGPERFLREIKTAARLQHPHILSVHDSGEAAGQLWFTMPYVEGESLRGRLRREKQLPVDEAVRITREAAQALDYAHRHGVVHRDVKPENLLLTEDGDTLVADFGVARALQDGEEALTQTGLAVGTPAYMSPEQAGGARDLDGRTDVYALGTVLHEMLAGEPPFAGPTPQAAVTRRFTEAPRPLRQLRETVPEAVEQAVLKALAKAPADRFPSAAEFARALAAPAAATPVSTSVNPTAVTPQVHVSATLTPAARRRVPAPAVTLGLGILIGLGALFGWLRSHGAGGPGDTGVKRVAVLPFENLGRSEDEYFADGLTDAVRGKLAALPNLEVMARASSSQYKRTSKTAQQIGRELGVQYLLTGTVRWDQRTAGHDRVQVSPELVEAGTGSTRWQEPFDAALTDVFQVQADVAARVAQALDVALGSGERARLEARPTTNLAAYDLYLRGNDYYERGYARENFRIARQLYERAVRADSSFALAYARLSIVRAAEYWFFHDRTDEALADAKAAADEALRLGPDLPEAHLALGYHHYWGRLDYDRALREFTAAQASRPNDAEVVFAIATVRRRQGKWAEAVSSFARATELDPRSNIKRFNLGETYWLLRDYIRAGKALDEAIGLAPDWATPYFMKAQVLLGSGASVREATGVLQAASDKVGFARLAEAVTANPHAIEGRFLLTADPMSRGAIDDLSLSASGDSIGYYELKAERYRYEGQRRLERSYLDSARAFLEDRVRARPEEASFHARLGLVYACLGRAADAIREGRTAVEQLPVSREAYRGAGLAGVLARIEAVAGRPDDAIDRLEYLLSIPSPISRPLLQVDPAWEPLRGDPRFESLVAGR